MPVARVPLQRCIGAQEGLAAFRDGGRASLQQIGLDFVQVGEAEKRNPQWPGGDSAGELAQAA